MNSNRGCGVRGMRTVERCEGVGVSSRYLCPPASNVNLRITLSLGCMSVTLVSKGRIGIEISWLLKLSDFAASCREEGDVSWLHHQQNVLVRHASTPIVGSEASSKRSNNLSSRGVDVRLRIVNGGLAIVLNHQNSSKER